MECICPHCGKKGGSGRLTYDFTKQFRQKLEADSGKRLPASYATSLKKVLNDWENAGKGPTFLSEKNLEAWCQTKPPKVKGVREGHLAVPFSWWQNQLADYLRGDNKLEEADRSFLEQLMVPENGGDTENQEQYVLELDVQFFKVEEGDIKFDLIRDANQDTIARERHCPDCGSVMSHWAGQYKELVLTVLGGPRISKSTALAACAHIFLDDPHNCKISWEKNSIELGNDENRQTIGDKNWHDFSEQCLGKYKKNLKVTPTKPTADNLIPRFTVLVTIKKGPADRDIERLILTAVDFPGEYNYEKDYVGISDRALRQYAEFYKNVDCVWYCTDGAEVEQIDISQSPETRHKYGYDPEKPLFSTRALVRGMNSFSAVFPKNIPVVFLLGKSDAIIENRDTQDYLYKNNYQPGEEWINMDEGYPALMGRKQNMRAKKLHHYLKSCNSELIDGFERAFPVHTYIATSNYGHGFRNEVPEGSLSPFQTELPFLWTLAICGFLPILEDDGKIYRLPRTGELSKSETKVRENLGMYGKSRDGRRPLRRKTLWEKMLRKDRGG